MNSNANASFMQQDNVEMLWDVLKGSVIYELMPKDERVLFRQHVVENVRGFYNKETTSDPTQNLMTMNKKFIETMINSLKQATSKPKQQMQRPDPLHTAKHIQDDRQQQFERKLTQKKEEFDNAINVKVPPAPNFTDQADTPISEMESLIAKTVAQRNFDMEKIHKMNASNPASQQFLSAQDTSLKNEKQRDNDNALKQIKISKEDIGQKYVEPSVIHLKTPMPLPPPPPPPSYSPSYSPPPLIKRITINEELNETHYYNSAASNHNNVNNVDINVGENMSLNNIFLKLKQIPVVPTVQEQLDAINKRLDDMQRDIDQLKR
jgi:hypothetical protein